MICNFITILHKIDFFLHFLNIYILIMIDDYSIIDNNNYGQYILLDEPCNEDIDLNKKKLKRKNKKRLVNDIDIENINDSEFDDFNYGFTKSSNNNRQNIFTSLFYNIFCLWKLVEVIIFKDKIETIEE